MFVHSVAAAVSGRRSSIGDRRYDLRPSVIEAAGPN
jgi:hypothetical protein